MDIEALNGVVSDDMRPAVAAAFTKAIRESFITCPARRTMSAVKDRFNILARVTRKLRKDLDWSWPKIFDHLSLYLRFELEGFPYEPRRGSSWTPPVQRDLLASTSR